MPVPVVVAARADLERRPDRVAGRDRRNRARPGPDLMQVRGRCLQRDGVDVDTVDIRDGAVRRDLRRSAFWRFDRHPGVVAVERRLSPTPTRRASAGRPAVGELQLAWSVTRPERLVDALPQRNRTASRVRFQRAHDLLQQEVAGRAGGRGRHRAQVHPGGEAVRGRRLVVCVRGGDVRGRPRRRRRADLQHRHARRRDRRVAVLPVRRRRVALRPLGEHDRKCLRTVQHDGPGRIRARDSCAGTGDERGSSNSHRGQRQRTNHDPLLPFDRRTPSEAEG